MGNETSTLSSTTTSTSKTTTTTTTSTTTTAEPTTTFETTTWFDDLTDVKCGFCKSRFCTAVSNFAQFSDHLLDGDHVIDIKFPNGWGIDSNWFLELYLSGNLEPLGVKGGIKNGYILDQSELQTALRVCLADEYENAGKIFMKLNGGMPWIEETLLCNCREKSTTEGLTSSATTTEATTTKSIQNPSASTTNDMKTTITTKIMATTEFQTRTQPETENTTTDSPSQQTTTTFWTRSAPKKILTKEIHPTSTESFSTSPSKPAPTTTEAETTSQESTTWTTSTPYFQPTTSYYFTTRNILRWYKRHSKWRHFLN
ncbi:Oidioi.mRNA.OKI2018_I69.chr1.g119.t1.cds [Oikopleura dioica]|uniref:Oidioi.mRNA.OKI2018_I69.chr1.g119.t1.cds n=1 Tax=Oikopleura dioica TaxID=34765 RepID=A0ABN7SJC1_OIKDI|nr:Oidioi.mRNA.OKI2018_I69.chr1.g119.t1.cds [Oikopleura dioica]